MYMTHSVHMCMQQSLRCKILQMLINQLIVESLCEKQYIHTSVCTYAHSHLYTYTCIGTCGTYYMYLMTVMMTHNIFSCLAIAFLAEKMPLKWILNHQQVIIMALMYVLLDLSNEVSQIASSFSCISCSHDGYQVSSGTVDQAKKLIDKILRQCNKPLMDDEQVSNDQCVLIY